MEKTEFKERLSQIETEFSCGVCKDIIKQIQYPNKVIFYSWGVSRFTYGMSQDGKPILRFKVNGRKFKGYVHVIYNLLDYYEIEFVSTHGNLKKKIDELYFDELQETIDGYVERINEYQF